MYKFCFIILHYLTIEDTVACVNSVKLIDSNNVDVSIVIVDNASSNGTGVKLVEKYDDDDNVSVILNPENEGFSRGNNIGCAFARKHIAPDFYVVLNNDVVVEQNNFCIEICRIYNNRRFDILGPDVYNRKLDLHQNPLMNSIPNESSVSKTIFINSLLIKFYPISVPIMYVIKKRGKVANKNIQYDSSQENIVLQGSCLVFSKEFVERKQCIFYPETFLYYEESLLKLWIDNNGGRSVYSPEIQVIHNESSSTRQEYKGMIKRWYKGAENIVNAAKVYLEELRKYAD